MGISYAYLGRRFDQGWQLTDPKDVDKVKYMPDIYMAGEIVDASDGVKLHTKGGNIHPIKAQGWKHF